MLFDKNTRKFMQEALKEAQKAFFEDEVPIGAVVVYEGKIIGRGHNQTERLKDATAHAEMIAITAAENYLEKKFLNDCELYVTAEPCVMCSGAILLSRIKKIYFGTFEPKFGAVGSLYNLIEANKYNRDVKVYSGLLEEECKSLLQKYFERMRNGKNEI